MQEDTSAWPAGIKKTKQRKCVLSVLERADSPLSAMDICTQTENEDCPVWLSTVYRILELFVKENIVLKTSVADNEMALYELNRNQHRHYAVCLNCHKVVEMDNCPMEEFIPQLADDDFHVLGHKLEMYGYCKDCNQKK
ncbi:MAG TPA: transcriptional repressor [Syntrophomonas sp.]|nr:transcriptional repressor [Syntrophomonas sp.]